MPDIDVVVGATFVTLPTTPACRRSSRALPAPAGRGDRPTRVVLRHNPTATRARPEPRARELPPGLGLASNNPPRRFAAAHRAYTRD